MTYKIVRFFARPGKNKRVVRGMTGLTLEQAQAHCADPETSYTTAKGYKARKRTEKHGPWFDGFEKE